MNSNFFMKNKKLAMRPAGIWIVSLTSLMLVQVASTQLKATPKDVKKYIQDLEYLNQVLLQGAEKARKLSIPKIKKVRSALGID